MVSVSPCCRKVFELFKNVWYSIQSKGGAHVRRKEAAASTFGATGLLPESISYPVTRVQGI